MTDLGLGVGTGALVAAGLCAFLALAASAFSALLERSGPIRLHHWAEAAGERLRGLYDQSPRFQAFRFLLSALAKGLPVVVFALLAHGLETGGTAARIGWRAVSLAALLTTILVVGGELLNRLVVIRDPERALELLTGAYHWTLMATLPLVLVLAPLFAVVARRRGEDDEASDEEIDAFIAVGTEEGILEPEDEEMVRGIVDFADTPVRSVMTPRIDVECAALDTPLDDLAARFIDSGHSRLPLFLGTIDQVVGIVHIRDMLRALHSDEPPPDASGLAHAPFFVPETKPLGQLLRELQARYQQMAVVVDEYGGTAGVVTVEDLIEEIVGELVDEHEETHPETVDLGDGAWLLDGGSNVDLLDELFELTLGTLPFETVGGLVFGLFEYVPEVGEAVEDRGLRYTVAEVDNRRIVKVRVERLDARAKAAREAAEETER